MKSKPILLISMLLAILVGAGCAVKSPSVVESTPVASANTIVAEGHFLPNENVYLSFLAQGRVSEILVDQGDQVSKGDILATLSDSQPAAASLASAKLELATAQQALNELIRMADVANAQAQLDLANAQRTYDRAVWNQKYANTPQVTDQNKIDVLDAKIIILEDEVEKAQKKYDGYIENADDDPAKAAALSRLANAKIALQDAKNTQQFSYFKPSVQDVLISDGTVAVAKAELDEAQVELDRLKDGPDPELLAIAQARLDNAKAQVAAAQYSLDNYQLIAPFDGIIADINISLSQQISPDIWAIAVIDPSQWYVDTNDLTEYDVVNIKVGDTADIVADALPDQHMQGIVEEIALAPNNSAGDVLYTVHLRLDDPDPRLKWGMTMEVTFTIEN